MTKQEVIQEAYGKYFKKCSPNENGWSRLRPQFMSKGELKDAFPLDYKNGYSSHLYLPKSLKGIENNNGWIKIESEADLPKDELGEYDGCCIECDVFIRNIGASKIETLYSKNQITHYKLIEKLLKPIY